MLLAQEQANLVTPLFVITLFIILLV